MKFSPFPELNTERLLLRQMQPYDNDTILFLRSDETITKFICRPKSRRTETIKDADDFIVKINKDIAKGKLLFWIIGLKKGLKMVGTICLWNFSEDPKTAELGYDLDYKFQGKGIMTEALTAVIDFGFKSLKLVSVEAFTHKENEASRKLLMKNGFVLLGDRKDKKNPNNIIFELRKAN